MAIQTVKTGAAVNDGTGDDARTAFTKINQNFTDNANAASRQVGTGVSNVMEVGAFGVGTTALTQLKSSDLNTLKTSGFYTAENTNANFPPIAGWCNIIVMPHLPNYVTQLAFSIIQPGEVWVRGLFFDTWTNWYKFYTGRNTSTDSNGFIKAASPVVRLFADKIEMNDEAKQQDITFEQLGVGDYLIRGSTGFAQDGWYIEMPKDANGNVLVAVVYEQLANNDISVKTYDYMLNKKGRIVPDLETPLDIPSTRWIDLRLQALPQPIQPLSEDETVATNAE